MPLHLCADHVPSLFHYYTLLETPESCILEELVYSEKNFVRQKHNKLIVCCFSLCINRRPGNTNSDLCRSRRTGDWQMEFLVVVTVAQNLWNGQCGCADIIVMSLVHLTEHFERYTGLFLPDGLSGSGANSVPFDEVIFLFWGLCRTDCALRSVSHWELVKED